MSYIRPRGRREVRHSPMHWGVTDRLSGLHSQRFPQMLPHDTEMTSARRSDAGHFGHVVLARCHRRGA